MATNTEPEVVRVTHEQVKRRASNLKERSSKDEYTTESSSSMDENHPSSKGKPSKGRREKELRKPDQQLYRPGRSRIGRNSSTGTSGSELNSSKEESPTKPVQDPVSEKVGSKGDQVSSALEDLPKKGSLGKLGEDERRDFGSRDHSGKGHDRSNKHGRGGRNRQDDNEMRDNGRNNQQSNDARDTGGRKRHDGVEARDSGGRNRQNSNEARDTGGRNRQYGNEPRDTSGRNRHDNNDPRDTGGKSRQGSNNPRDTGGRNKQDNNEMRDTGGRNSNEARSTGGRNRHGSNEARDSGGRSRQYSNDPRDIGGKSSQGSNDPKDTGGRNRQGSNNPRDTGGRNRQDSNEVRDTGGRNRQDSNEVRETGGRNRHGINEIRDTGGKNKQHNNDPRDSGGRNRHHSNETKDTVGDKSGRIGSRRSEGQEHSHQQDTRARSARQHQVSMQADGKKQVKDHGQQSAESWEIKPEDWEADVKTPPRDAKGKPPDKKHSSIAREKVDHGRVDPGRVSKDVEKDKATQHKSATVERGTKPPSLMGEDWDSEFEEQVRGVSISPPKAYDRRNEKSLESGERFPRNRGNADPRHDTQTEKSKPAPKKDLVKSSRQNYASEMQKLRAKKELVEKESALRKEKESERRMEKDNVHRREEGSKHTKETESVLKQEKDAQAPSAKDLKITIRTGPDDAEGSRLVQDKSSKRYSSGRSRQSVNSESSAGSENISFEKMALKPDDWEGGVDDLNYHVESMVITNQKYASRDIERQTGFQSSHSESRNTDNRERIRDDIDVSSTWKGDVREHSARHQSEDQDIRKERPAAEKREVHGHAREMHHKREYHDEKPRKEHDQERHRHGSKSDRDPRDDQERLRHGSRSDRDPRDDQERHRHGSRSDRDPRDQEARGRHGSGGRWEEHRRRDRDRVSVCSDEGSEKQGRRRGSSDMEESSSKHSGGILRLPGKKEPDREQQQLHNYIPVYDQFYKPPPSEELPIEEEPKHKAKGRAGDKSRLWDPSKPNQKPALQQHHVKQGELHFQDPEYELEPERMESSPAGQPDVWNAYFQNYPPGFAGAFPPSHLLPHPGMRPQFPPPGYMAPSPSWADQVEASHAYQSGQAAPPLPPQPMMQYPPPFRPHPYHPPPGLPPPQGLPNPAHLAMMQEHHSVNRQSAQKLLRDAARCEGELSEAVAHGISSREGLKHLLDKQRELEQVYEGIILLDLDLCNQYNVEQTLWKNSYYQVIEGMRRALEHEAHSESYKEDLIDFMQHGTTFYEGLLTKLQSTYNFQLENRTGLDPLHEEPRRTIKLALLSSQRCMIALGDIARYKEQTNETSNYGKARSWYVKAQHLAPRNGRPYNQLAILALYTRRKLDAVYYYVRSLAATNPFLTARESLMTLFEEVRRKVAHKEEEEMRERRDLERRREERRRRRRQHQDENRGRKEVWVAHDGRKVGGDRLEEGEDEEMEQREDLTILSPAELNKKFVLSFLNVHGKLFTKTGMEAFEHATERLLREFRALLDHTPTAILSTRLIQLMAINMFAAANTSPQSDVPVMADMRPLLLEQAVHLGLDMFAILVNRCCSLLQAHLDGQESGQAVLSQDLHELLPGVKVYADWMMCHSSLWNPPPCCNTTSNSDILDVWSTLARFLNLVRRITPPDVTFTRNNDQGTQEVLLPEDLALSGFVPLMALPLQPVFIQSDTSKILANDRVRLDSLTVFGEYLSGQETPLISYTVKTDSYISVAPKEVRPRRPEEKPRLDDDYQDGSDDVIVMESYQDEEEVAHGDGTISRLRERRDSLERQLRDKEHREHKIQAIVDSHRSQRLLEIVIKPYFLVPDTNCFIDHLLIIQQLVGCQRYVVIVPLVVINELDGLARGSREGQYSDPHHAARVVGGARQAVGYLEEEFGARNRCLVALTAKGNTLNNIRFRSEEAGARGNNDDHILRCCMHYCEDDARQYMPHDKDSPLQIERQVVLLTNDRNLRVKAIQQNVPVKDIVVFMKWAKV